MRLQPDFDVRGEEGERVSAALGWCCRWLRDGDSVSFMCQIRGVFVLATEGRARPEDGQGLPSLPCSFCHVWEFALPCFEVEEESAEPLHRSARVTRLHARPRTAFGLVFQLKCLRTLTRGAGQQRSALQRAFCVCSWREPGDAVVFPQCHFNGLH